MSFKEYAKDKMCGGKADNKTIEDIATHHKIPIDSIQKEFEIGIEHEKEHTIDDILASEIAKDHLWENPSYYSDLKSAKIDEEWDEMCEDFDSLELLDERKFEKVKLARNLLSKIGYANAYARNEKGKYKLRSRDIKKLMKSLNYTFDSAKGRWIETPKKAEKTKEEPVYVTPKQDKINTDVDKEKIEIDKDTVVIWTGHANPWHKGHHEITEYGTQLLNKVGAYKLYIMLIKENDEEIGMDFYEQIDLIKSIYKDDDRIEVCKIPVPTSSIVDIMSVIANQGLTVLGWITGTTNIEKYKKQLQDFKQNKYKDEFIQKTSINTQYPIKNNIIFVDIHQYKKVNGITSEKARDMAKSMSFHQWLNVVCPEDLLHEDDVISAYLDSYKILKSRK